ncbi:hypothetical protein PYCCODRAFT_522469 [Trametes coccinea BRFM310]|uniref:F-box domain-containing protein n=1 Tax=Trametes coccinea (strain BRFM310) TaxID=1353009 RepID=A0A1Y2IK15_TRAC3|nr:hypothetical protein PYCCODRAFT_522469 [Trametes coccinea BRFM310]
MASISTSGGIQGLPQEVFHIILDYLGNNKTVLRNCSLVCRSWLQASRPRLFSIVSLYACERRLIGFQQFLDTHPDIAGHVRSLMLRHPMDEQSSGTDGPPEASITPRTLVRTAKRLPRLRECQFYFVHIVPSRPPDAADATPEDTHDGTESRLDLSVFHIFGSSHQETSPLLELLSCFRMDRLELELVTFVQEPEALTHLPRHVRRIEVRDIWADLDTADDEPIAILPPLASALAPGILQAFHCSWKDWDGCAVVGAFLHDVGSTILELALNMSVASWVEDLGSYNAKHGVA